MFLNYSTRLDIFCIRKLEELKRWVNIDSLSHICYCLFFTPHPLCNACRSELQMNADPQYVQMVNP
jgi:hypothetical protein